MTGQPGTILIGDDDEGTLRSMAELLEHEGYTCQQANEAAKAAKLLAEQPFDLLIADIQMPGNRNLELIRWLAQRPQAPRIILITGHPTLESAIASVQLQVSAYLTKPLDPAQLLQEVRRAVGLHRLCAELRRHGQPSDPWEKLLENLRSLSAAKTNPLSSVAIDSYLALAFKNIVVALEDVKRLVEHLAGARSTPEACHLMSCPRLAAVREVLGQSVATLEKTKNAFKSKELAQLRRNLEELLATLRP